MAKPPPETPHSDVDGVNRDARIQVPNRDPSRDPGSQLEKADQESAGQPDEGSVLGKEP